MTIIDVNTAIGGRDSIGAVQGLPELMARMDTYRISQSVCYHQHAMLDPKDGNEKMAQLAAKSNGRVSVCAVLDPMLGAENLPGTGTLSARLKAFQPACLRVFPTADRMVFHPFYWQEIMEAASACKLPVIVDGDYTPDFFCSFPEMARTYPDVKFILIRYGACNGRHIMPILQNLPNVYFTVERMLDNLQIEEIAERFGCDRLLFGSGYPERPMEGILGLALYANITDSQRQKLLHENWEAIGG